MTFQLDPIFHTKTMVQILKEQGALKQAEKICQEILTKHPVDSEVENLLKSIQSTLNQNKNLFGANQSKNDALSKEKFSDENNSLDEETTI